MDAFERPYSLSVKPEHYIVVDPLGSIDQMPYHGSVADDLLDLGNAMREAVWRFENNGRGDAHHFVRSQQFHWEMHLRELSLYLANRRFRLPRSD